MDQSSTCSLPASTSPAEYVVTRPPALRRPPPRNKPNSQNSPLNEGPPPSLAVAVAAVEAAPPPPLPVEDGDDEYFLEPSMPPPVQPIGARPPPRRPSLSNKTSNSDLSSNSDERSMTVCMPARPANPPVRDRTHTTTQTEVALPKVGPPEAEVLALRVAISEATAAKDWKKMKTLLIKAKDMGLRPSEEELISKAAKVLHKHRKQERLTQAQTLTTKLSTGLEEGNKELLQETLAILAKMKEKHLEQMPESIKAAIAKTKAELANMNLADVNTVTAYIKQGMALRNKDVLLHSLEKAKTIGRSQFPELLLTEAEVLLAQLDNEHLAKFYLENALLSKDVGAIQDALTKARALHLGDYEYVKHAEDLMRRLEGKGKNKEKADKEKSRWTLGGKSKSARSLKLRGQDKWKLFGGDLVTAIEQSGMAVPSVCHQCVDYLRKNGLQEKGLFRVPGNADMVALICGKYDAEEDVVFNDVTDVAAVFKQYLRLLPEPLIPFAQYKAFVSLGNTQPDRKSPKRLEELQKLVLQLPTAHYAVLRFVMQFLYDVAAQSDINLMTADNLAVCFAPNLLRNAKETPATMMQDMKIVISVVTSLIEHSPTLYVKETNHK